jgi:hypothetical protein
VADTLGLLLAVAVTGASADDGTAAPQVPGKLDPQEHPRLVSGPAARAWPVVAVTPGVRMDAISRHLQAIQILFDAADERGIHLWLENGWAIDARLGVVSREHGDIDVAYPKDWEEDYVGLLRSLGYGPPEHTDYGFLCWRGDILLDSEPCYRVGDAYGFTGFPPGACRPAKEGLRPGP